MVIEDDIKDIRDGLKAGRFANEAAISQGIVLRLLHALSWPAYDTRVVWPEYALSGRRVDFALCYPAGKPVALIEVKQLGQSDNAERQLFEYAFHDGVPMAILTDGREWNFFLPAEQGDYAERRVYKLDIAERDLAECAGRLRRYLFHADVASGKAIQAARDDYASVSRDRQIRAALPKAWHHLIADEDEMLLEIVADRAESLCGFKPDPDMVADFLKQQLSPRPAKAAVSTPGHPAGPSLPVSPRRLKSPSLRLTVPQTATGQFGYSLKGRFYPAPTRIDVLRQVFEAFASLDPAFQKRFAAMPHGRSRRYLDPVREHLYPNRPDLCRESSVQLSTGWWMGTNYSRRSIGRIIESACNAAKVKFGTDLIVSLD